MSKKLIAITIILFIAMWWATIYFFGLWGALALVTGSTLFTIYISNGFNKRG
jgi:hypothetical protein